MDENKKSASGKFRTWTEESIRWYDEASDYTKYHEALLPHLLPHLKADDRCCELACGTGHLARTLAPHVASYTANDIATAAMDFNASQLACLSEGADMELVTGDWKTALAGRRFDVVLFSFFGAILRDWEQLEALAEKRIIAITYGIDPGGRKSKHETGKDIIAFLEERGIPYSYEECSLDFGQPLRDMDDARRYLAYYYKLKDISPDEYLREHLETKPDGTLYFPKMRHLGIVVIDLK